jgi:hypothetical protein
LVEEKWGGQTLDASVFSRTPGTFPPYLVDYWMVLVEITSSNRTPVLRRKTAAHSPPEGQDKSCVQPLIHGMDKDRQARPGTGLREFFSTFFKTLQGASLQAWTRRYAAPLNQEIFDE